VQEKAMRAHWGDSRGHNNQLELYSYVRASAQLMIVNR
jgi:hypothetical protein